MEKVVTYVDGFDLDFGLKAKKWRCYYWLNIQKLSQNLLRPTQELVCTKYFTSRIFSHPPDKQERQTTYVEALSTLPNFRMFYGKYRINTPLCQNCGFKNSIPQEKMTDVNIAVELMTDAFQNSFDTALLISADSDLTAPVSAVRGLFPDKRVVIAFPPERRSYHLEEVASASFIIGERSLTQSLFPPEVRKPDGFVLKCPDLWRSSISPYPLFPWRSGRIFPEPCKRGGTMLV